MKIGTLKFEFVPSPWGEGKGVADIEVQISATQTCFPNSNFVIHSDFVIRI
jgi:hypothetical protein